MSGGLQTPGPPLPVTALMTTSSKFPRRVENVQCDCNSVTFDRIFIDCFRTRVNAYFAKLANPKAVPSIDFRWNVFFCFFPIERFRFRTRDDPLSGSDERVLSFEKKHSCVRYVMQRREERTQTNAMARN